MVLNEKFLLLTKAGDTLGITYGDPVKFDGI